MLLKPYEARRMIKYVADEISNGVLINLDLDWIEDRADEIKHYIDFIKKTDKEVK